jgi:uncharacterized protein YjiS (DUF1127 family)
MESAMTIYADTHKPPHFAGLLYAVAGFAVARVRNVLQLLKSRRDANVLSGLDDRMLADIGLTRNDLYDAYSEPMWRDPTAVLVNRATERRVHRRRSPGLPESVLAAPSIVPSIPKHVSVNCVG